MFDNIDLKPILEKFEKHALEISTLVFLTCVIYVFLPSRYQTIVHIGLIFLFLYLSSKLFVKFFNFSKSYILQKKKEKQVKKFLIGLNDYEKGIMREFIIMRITKCAESIYLPYKNSWTISLEEKGLIEAKEHQGRNFNKPYFHEYKRSYLCIDLINSKNIDMPVFKSDIYEEFSEEERRKMQDVIKKRPKFISEYYK